MIQLKIADLIININGDYPEMFERLSEYYAQGNQSCDIYIDMQKCDVVPVPEGNLFVDEDVKWIRKISGDDAYCMYNVNGLGDVLSLMDVDPLWNKALCYYMNNENKSPETSFGIMTTMSVNMLMGFLFRYGLLYHQGVVIHSSTVEWRGKGIMFSAPSGTGKSTHVRLWQQRFKDAVKVLNDDTPAVRLIDGKPRVFGTPWSGSGSNTNDSAPLSHIVVLEQAPENSISTLSVQESILRLMPRAILPYFDKRMMGMAINTFSSILSSVPVYLLKCRPDLEAVEMVYQWVK